jgi:hypothetical protein
MRRTAILLALAALTACGSEPGPGGTTSGEAKALDDAAEMLEDQRLPDSALRPPAEQATAAGAPAQ